MEAITNFFVENLNTYLLFVIILGGIFVVKYTKEYTKLKDVYKVLIASVLFSFIFYLMDDCKGECAPKYLFTYLTATSFYELIVKWVLDKIKNVFTVEKNKT
jgi:hypothetical protein